LNVQEQVPKTINTETTDNGTYAFKSSVINPSPAHSYMGANEEIKEEFREDSESSNEYISNILNTQEEID